MADAIVSAVAERIVTLIEEQIRNHVNLVRGVEKEVQSLSSELNTIRNVLDDAESRRFKDKNVDDWLVRLEQTSYVMEDVLDQWNYAVLKLRLERYQYKGKVCSFIPSSCLCFKKFAVRHDVAGKIKIVKQQLDLILAEKDRYNFVMSRPSTDPSPKTWRVQSTSLVDLVEVHGRAMDMDILVSKLMYSSAGSQEELSNIVSIVGVGGLGKTTLAQLIYNDRRVRECFELRIWVCVSDPFDVVGIAKGIIESVGKGSCPNTKQLDILFKHLIDSISGKRFLLVLDDVWTDEYEKWEPLKNSLKYGGVGSKILVTTRNERVAKIMGTMDNDIHHLGQLSDEECWLLLRSMALFGRKKEEFDKFEEIGKRIAKKCNGLPLAAKTLGSLLRFKNSLEEWRDVLNSEMWEMKEVKLHLFPHLLLSYNELSPTLKRCFSYCTVFPKDSEIVVESLIGNWMALGYLGPNTGDMELKGRECFNVLAMHSLFQDFKKDHLDGKIRSCKMHDIVHDFAQFLRKSGGVEAARMNNSTCQACDPFLVSSVNEFGSLFWDGESPPNLCACLARLRVLSLSWCGLQSIPLGMENLIHLRWLNLAGNKLSCQDLRIFFQLYYLQTLFLQNCSLKEIPTEIGNLIHLMHLDLSNNWSLEELPESICGLRELRTLNLDSCKDFSRLPNAIHRLVNLKHLHNSYTYSLKEFPQGLAQLTGLRTLNEFRGGSGWRKLGLLKNLNLLGGSLALWIRLTDDFEGVVEDARETELRKKIYIQNLMITFWDDMDDKHESSLISRDAIDALEPHPNLRNLEISFYSGSKLPGWISSPLNQLRYIKLFSFSRLLSLPSLAKLPCLEEIYISGMAELRFVGREFLGITKTTTRTGEISDIGSSSSFSSSSSSLAVADANTIAFPKLKTLTFHGCPKWKEWEDITAEEEESAAVSIMPCLSVLKVQHCNGLTTLPQRLLHKVSSLEMLSMCGSVQLEQHYRDKDGSATKSGSRNPCRQLID